MAKKRIIIIFSLVLFSLLLVYAYPGYKKHIGCKYYDGIGYIVKKNSVYYSYQYQGAGSGEYHCGKEKINGADPGSFEIMNKAFGKDDNNLYCRGLQLDTSLDIKTVELLKSGRIKDKDYVYSHIPQPENIGCKNLYTVARSGENINCLESDCNTNEEGGTCEYFKDEKNIYWHAKIIKNADPETFEVIKDSCSSYKDEYAIDKNQVYKNGEILGIYDIDTFEYFNCGYTRDKNGIYVYDKVPQVDLETFVFVNSCEDDYVYSKDENYVYKGIGGEILLLADPDSFEYLGDGYAKDKRYVYKNGIIKYNLDTKTFKIIN